MSDAPDPALQVNARRHRTRNRPPTTKALEVVACGLLGSEKRKGDLKNMVTSWPSQQARKATKELVASSGDAKTSYLDAEVE
jgi:hypothetical protein